MIKMSIVFTDKKGEEIHATVERDRKKVVDVAVEVMDQLIQLHKSEPGAKPLIVLSLDRALDFFCGVMVTEEKLKPPKGAAFVKLSDSEVSALVPYEDKDVWLPRAAGVKG